jgi:hypothetical protein
MSVRRGVMYVLAKEIVTITGSRAQAEGQARNLRENGTPVEVLSVTIDIGTEVDPQDQAWTNAEVPIPAGSQRVEGRGGDDRPQEKR